MGEPLPDATTQPKIYGIVHSKSSVNAETNLLASFRMSTEGSRSVAMVNCSSLTAYLRTLRPGATIDRNEAAPCIVREFYLACLLSHVTMLRCWWYA